MNRNAVRFIGAVDRNQDVALVDDVAAKNAVDNVRRDHLGSPAEKQRCAQNISPFGVDLLIADKKSFPVQRTQRLEKASLPFRPDENHRERDGGQDKRPVGAVRQLAQRGQKIRKGDAGDEDGSRQLPSHLFNLRKDENDHQAGDGHRSGYGHAVGRGEILRFLEKKDHENDRDHEGPADKRNVDLRFDPA